MLLKEWMALFLCIMMIVGVWCIFVVSMNKSYHQKTLTNIQPLDLTVTFCDSCRKCTSHDTLDAIEFEECNEAISL